MDWLNHVPYLMFGFFVFVLGSMVGSFLNVLIARLPFEKSIIWPSSRCFVCYRSISILDNLPLVGYLRLRGRCRTCKAPFSARYLWVEIGTGLACLALYFITVIGASDAFGQPWHFRPGAAFSYVSTDPVKLVPSFVVLFAHSALLCGLIAAAVVDAKHKIIPIPITYFGTLLGLIFSVALPWPWPNSPADLAAFTNQTVWLIGDNPIPNGVSLWPFWAPWPSWVSPGSWQMGLLNGLIGAAVGMMIGRGIKLFAEIGIGREALGLGDADLLMMSGAFLGWQPIVLALPVGAVLTLAVVVPLFIIAKLRRKKFEPAMPFGPGIAAGVVACWLGWPWLGELARAAFFDPISIGVSAAILGGGLMVFGFLFRGRKAPPAPAS